MKTAACDTFVQTVGTGKINLRGRGGGEHLQVERGTFRYNRYTISYFVAISCGVPGVSQRRAHEYFVNSFQSKGLYSFTHTNMPFYPSFGTAVRTISR